MTYVITVSDFMETDLSPAELMSRHQESLIHPYWDIKVQGSCEEASWLT